VHFFVIGLFMDTKYSDLAEKISEKLLDSPSIGELVLTIVEEAFCKFDDAGAADDFGLQYVGPGKIVFGRTNRVSWSASEGFVPDETYCTEHFLRCWAIGK